jgi:hypothetical protein
MSRSEISLLHAYLSFFYYLIYPRIIKQLFRRLSVFGSPLKHASQELQKHFLVLTPKTKLGILQARALWDGYLSYPFPYPKRSVFFL